MGLSSLKRLAESPTALNNLKAWIAMDKTQRSTEYAKALTAGGGKVVRDTKPGCLIPFAVGGDNKIIVPCRFLVGATGGQAGTLATAVKSMTTGQVFQLDQKPADFEMPTFANAFKRAARVTLTLRSGTTASRTSRLTGGKYSAKESDSVSQSFGVKPATTTDHMKDYTNVVSAASAWAVGADGRSYKVTPEGGK